MSSLYQSHKILFLNTLAFTICFACWTLNGVLITYLVDKGIFNFSVVEVGWLLEFQYYLELYLDYLLVY